MREDARQRTILLTAGAAAVIWIGLKIAPLMEGGLPGVLSGWGEVFRYPFRISLCRYTLRTVVLLLAVYGAAAGSFFEGRRNLRIGEEHGSAKWGSPRAVNRVYAGHGNEGNKALTRNVSLGLDSRRHRRNLNVLVCGGSGSGKTRYYAKANVLEAKDCSLILLDPKGELLRDTGDLLRRKGYTVKVLDLIHMERSHCYNPFVYLKDDNDVQRLVTNLFSNTSAAKGRTSDPFWDQAAMMLLSALIFYLKYRAYEREQNFPMILEMIRAGDVKENNDNYRSPLDLLFDKLESEEPDHIALKYYRSYRSGAAKTLKSIQITLLARLEKYNLDTLAGISMYDELELDLVGERKTAVFAVIPDNDSSFNFVVGMLYTQLFQQLYYRADTFYGGRLPVHVHFLMDEFANVALPTSFDKLLSTMRSREISVSIIIQNMAQLKTLFEKQWESITGNCDTFLYLGGNEESTHEYVSKLLGRETIEEAQDSESKGKTGSRSKSWHKTGRELMTPDEVRKMDNRYALLFIRGERPVRDLKCDILRHRDLCFTADGGGQAYRYGEDHRSRAAVWEIPPDEAKEELGAEKHETLVLIERDLEAALETFDKERRKENEQREQKPEGSEEKTDPADTDRTGGGDPDPGSADPGGGVSGGSHRGDQQPE